MPSINRKGLFLLVPVWFLIIFGCTTAPGVTSINEAPVPSPSFTSTEATTTSGTSAPATSTPAAQPTFTLTTPLNLTPTIPSFFEKNAGVAGLDPKDLNAVYWIIHDALGANNPAPLAALVHYPLATCQTFEQKISTPQEFIQAYPTLMDEETRQRLYEQKPEDLGISYRGVMFGTGEIWVSGLCDPDQTTCAVFIIKFMNYCLATM
jgi:hypothetical protein